MMFEHLRQDLHYSLRTLASRPVFAVAAALTLALGIGVNVAVFAVVDTLVLRRVSTADPVLASVVAALVVVAIAACAIPTLRPARIGPMEALRDE